MASRPRPSASRTDGVKIFGFSPTPLFAPEAKADKNSAQSLGIVYILGRAADPSSLAKVLEQQGIHSWQIDRALKPEREISHLAGRDAPVWIIKQKPTKADALASVGREFGSDYSRARDLVGSFVGLWDGYAIQTLQIEFIQANDDEKRGALVGLELALYRYTAVRAKKKLPTGRPPAFRLKGVTEALLAEAQQIGIATNLARHLVNVPPSELQPASYAHEVASLFKGAPGVKVVVWGPEACAKEGMGLLCATGRAAAFGAHLVHIRYRPKDSKKKKAVAFVGKGVTFDSGGLDIKPSSGMRFMKKDMGGSAALVGLCWWLSATKHKTPVDIYLAMAENAVSAASFHPGDVFTARNGTSVEIHNTDAEGRLVMADALCLALEAKGDDQPQYLIDVATLTGAVKVGLGSDIAGVFANDDALAARLSRAGDTWGDPVWRLPLFKGYETQLRSGVADLSNCASSPYGGAITAALFLQRFVGKQPWAHLDIYAWNDAPSGPIREPGGNGQAVQTLIGFLNDQG